jgi:peptidoglycan/LPS O-acetylase OafA/YrhL
MMSDQTNSRPAEAAVTVPVGEEAKAPVRKPAGAKPRLVGLDVMRFIAVMMVLYAHASMFTETRRFFNGKIGLLYDALYQLRVGCWVAIDLFFVLSGFLISGLLFQELAKTGNVSVGRFLVRRGFKIYPVFWVMLLATVVGNLLTGYPAELKKLCVELLFVQNYAIGPWPSFVPSYWGITWSLGVEEHFYFMMAGLVWLLKRNCGPKWSVKIHALPKLFVCVAIGCIVARIITCAFVPYDAKHKFLFQYATHVRMDALFFGVLLSYYWHNRWSAEYKNSLMNKRWLFVLGALGLLSTAIYRDELWFNLVGYVCTYVGSAYLLVSLLSLDRKAPNLCVRAMAWLGRHSYSVYLWHVMSGYWLLPYITLKGHNMTCWTTNLFIYFVMCWTVGTVMSVAVEFPMLRVRDRFFPWLNTKAIPK